MSTMTADEVVRESEMRRSEAFSVKRKPLYSLERIRRRALCEAICEGVPDAVLIGMRETMRQAAMKARTEHKAEVMEMKPLAEVLEAVEKEAIRDAMAKAPNASRAAKLLDMPKTTFYRKLDEFGYRSSTLAGQ